MHKLNAWIPLAVVGCVLGGGIADVSARQGQEIETFVCESEDNKHHECRYRSSGAVTVHVKRQMSRSRCVFNDTWGTFDGGVWVDYGCRAEFVVRRPPQDVAHRPTGGTLSTVKCESKDESYQQCRVDGINPSSVHIERKLGRSPCERGETWGVSDGENSPPGIWVKQGCRAVFAYSTDRSFNSYGGTPHDFELPCESIRGAWQHCEVSQVHLARIKLIAGNDACNVYKAWGVDDTGIWVNNNCQGAFRVTYRH